MSSASTLDRKNVCPVCQRGHFTFLADVPARIVYRAEDLKNIQDVNLTWEWFTSYGTIPEDSVERGMWPAPSLLVTPKVMNLLRGKTKKEQKYEGVSFTPIWIEDENGRQTLATGKANVEMGAPTSEAPIAKPTRKRGTKRT